MKLSASKLPGKYLIPGNYYRLIARQFGHNVILDSMVKSISFDDLGELEHVGLECLDLTQSEYKGWVEKYYPQWKDQFGCIRYKKLLEFFTTFRLLEPRPDDVFMDAAGSTDSYLAKLECQKMYLQDIKIPQDGRTKLGKNVDFIESDAGSIPLPDASIDKISCHHSFEHFQGASDTLFINEVQRLLKPKGKCCIVPVFIGDRFIEATDALTFRKRFDGKSKRVIDPTASITGGSASGSYARIYDLRAFQERVMGAIDLRNFKVTISELRLDGDVVPDLALDCHKHVTAINRPYRAMTIERDLQ